MTGRPRLILASGSPQRRAILETLGVEFVTSVSGADELAVGAPSAVALENALRKARAVADRLAAGSRPEPTSGPADSPPVLGVETPADSVPVVGCRTLVDSVAVLGVDTLVAVGSPDAENSTIYGKPADERAARATLEALSGRTHIVVSGLALVAAGAPTRSATVVTRVRMRRLEAATIDWYVACGEWAGRAGGYAIQGRGIVLVAGIEGDYSNVVGLPVQGLLDLWPELLGH